MKKKKVLVLTTTFPRWLNDSTPPFVLELEKRLTKDFEIHILAPHYQGAKKEEEMEGLHVHRFQYFWPAKLQKLCYDGGILPNLKKYFLAKIQIIPFFISELTGLIKIASVKKIEIVHSHWIIPNGLLAAIIKKMFGIKHILTIHAGDLALLDKLPFKKLLARFILKNTDQVTFVSQFGKDLFVKILCENKKIDSRFSIIPMGIDTKTFSRKINSGLGKDFTGKATDRKNILFMGRLADKKGTEYLIRAVKIVARSGKKIKVYIVGDGPLKEKLLNLAKELKLENIIDFTGSKAGKAKVEFFAMADILVVPSIKTEFGDVEGIPVVLMEGLASGKAIVASSVGGIPEIIIHNINGLLIPEKDFQALAKSITTVLNNNKLKARLEQGAKKSAGKYDLKIIAGKYNKLYSRV